MKGSILLDALVDTVNPRVERFLEDSEHHVNRCAGPDEGTLCPILGGEGCPKFGESHGVIFHLDLDRAQHRAILRKYLESRREGTPVVAWVARGQAHKYAELLEPVRVWEHEPGAADLDGFAAEVEANDYALGFQDAPG